jgi:hypothetical protein
VEEVLIVTFGEPDAIQHAKGRSLALYRPRRLVAYLARHAPSQALYLFKTDASRRAPNRLRTVSQPVRLLYVANTRRTASKATTALNLLKKRLGNAAVDALPDLFWCQLGDFIDRRGKRIAGYVTSLIDRQQLAPTGTGIGGVVPI